MYNYCKCMGGFNMIPETVILEKEDESRIHYEMILHIFKVWKEHRNKRRKVIAVRITSATLIIITGILWWMNT